MSPSKKHVVRQGECVSSIAYRNGLFWQTVWEHADNVELRRERESPFVLRPGDVVVVPALQDRTVQRPTGARHTFRRKGVPAKLQLQLLDNNEPLANLPYVLEYSGQEQTGTTDDDGRVEAYLPPDTPRAVLRVDTGEEERVYELALRALNPKGEIDGAQSRLSSLGYYDGPIHGELDAATIAAVRRFQREQDLDVSGELDDATTARLADVHSGAADPAKS